MSVTGTSAKIIFLGDGGSYVFDFSSGGDGFTVYDQTDIVVTVFTIATGATTQLTLTTNYTVALSPVANSNQYTGIVTLLTPYDALSSDYKIVIERVLPYTQEISLVDNEKTPAAVQEEGYDRATMLIQQLREMIGRAVLADITQSTGFTLPYLTSGFLYTDGANVSWTAITETITNYNGTVSHGADASKPVAPSVGDLYFATDTYKLYGCLVGGSWFNQWAFTTLVSATLGVTGTAQVNGNFTCLGSIAGYGTIGGLIGAFATRVDTPIYLRNGVAEDSALGLVTQNSGGIVQGKRLGAWTTPSKDTVYLAATDLFVTANVVTGTVTIKTDAANPPTVVRVQSNNAGANPSCSASCVVRKGDYYLIEDSGSDTVTAYAIAMGT